MPDIEQMYKDHFDDLKRVVLTYVKDEEEANDITQDTFIRAWSSLDTFRGDSELLTWLTRIAIHTLYNRRRQNKLETVSMMVLDGEEILPSAYKDVGSPEEQLIAHEKELSMVEKLKGMEEKYKQPLILRDYHGYSYQQIADELGIPVNTVRSHIHRGRQQLKQS